MSSLLQPIIASFPTELLCEIFLLLRETQDSWQYEDDITWLSVAHVNRWWRRAATGLPKFWTPLPVGRPKLAALALRRVKNVPLVVRANLDTRNNEFIRMVCQSYRHRIWKVDLSGRYDATEQFLPNILQIPNLEVLSLTRPESDSMSASQCVLQPDYEPLSPFLLPVHTLSLEGYLLPWNLYIFQKLTRLHIRYLPLHLREDGVSYTTLQALSAMPNLQQLILDHALSPIQFDDIPPIRLPNLKSIKVTDNSDSLRQTSLLVLPPSCVVELGNDDNGLEDVDLYETPVPDLIHNLIERHNYPAVVLKWGEDNVSVCAQNSRRENCFIFRVYSDNFRRSRGNQAALSFADYFLKLFDPAEVLCLEFKAISNDEPKTNMMHSEWREWRDLWHSLIRFKNLRKLHISEMIPPYLLEMLVLISFAEAGYAVTPPYNRWYVESAERGEMLPALTDVEFEDLSCTASFPNALKLLTDVVWIRRRRGLKVSNIILRNCTNIPFATTTFLRTIADIQILGPTEDPTCGLPRSMERDGEWVIGQAYLACMQKMRIKRPSLLDVVLPEQHPQPASVVGTTTVKDYREWRTAVFASRQSVGFVPTMGALHDGHLSLVKRSLAGNDLTVVSIFVNPAQFSPHEDLTTYPRTLSRDIELLETQNTDVSGSVRKVSALFLPPVNEMYPSGISQELASQVGSFVEVKGLGEEMEGKSRPTFFRGVATVVTKLFNVIQPTNAYFGQKDIQQALLLRRMCRDLLMSHPDPDHLHIIPTTRDASDSLALSSRNTYLSNAGRAAAPILYRALKSAESAWNAGSPKHACMQAAVSVISHHKDNLPDGIPMTLDYIEFNSSSTFRPLEDQVRQTDCTEPIILSGALWVDKTRLIDNIILGDARNILN